MFSLSTAETIEPVHQKSSAEGFREKGPVSKLHSVVRSADFSGNIPGKQNTAFIHHRTSALSLDIRCHMIDISTFHWMFG